MIRITDEELDRFLHDDLPHGDLTTRSLGLGAEPTSMVFRAGAALVASGIASAAARIVTAARAVRSDVVVACTRKTFPGTKAVAIKAVIAGGAVPHRLGLSDSVLLFPEHRALLGEDSMAGAVRRLKASCPEKKVVVEVTSMKEASAAAQAGADVVQLEKFTPAQTAAAVECLASHGVLIAAAAYAEAGAAILVTSAPYSAPPVDIKVTMTPVTT